MKIELGIKNMQMNVKFGAKKSGSVSLFLVVVIPVIILGALYLFDLLQLRYQDEKALKIVSAVSEAHLSRYNEYLKKEYKLIASLNLDVLSESVDAYFSHNGYQSLTKSDMLPLDEPENFKKVVVKSMISLVSASLYDALLDQLGIGEWKSGLSNKLKEIDKGMEEIANLIKFPDEIEKMTKTRDIPTLKMYIGEMKGGIPKNDEKFTTLSTEMREGLEAWDEIWKSVNGTLESAEEKYSEVKKDALDYTETVSEYIEAIEECTEGADACFEQIEELEKQLKNESLSEEAIERINRRIEILTEEMDGFDVRLQKTKTALNQLLENKAATLVDRGPFDSIIHKIRKVCKRLTQVFDNSICDGKVLNITNSFPGMNALTPMGMLERIAMTEWCVNVMSCYEKDSGIDGRAIRGELEYIVSGKTSERDSLSATKFKIVELRSIPNFITFLQTDFKRELDAFLIAIPAPFQQIAQAICYSGTILLESYRDVSVLLDGGKIPLFKKPNEWGMTMDELLGNEEMNPFRHETGLAYKDYMRMMIYMQDEKDTVVRSMHLVNASIEEASEKEFSLSDYTVGHVICVEYDAESIFSKRRSRIIYENAYD